MRISNNYKEDRRIIKLGLAGLTRIIRDMNHKYYLIILLITIDLYLKILHLSLPLNFHKGLFYDNK